MSCFYSKGFWWYTKNPQWISPSMIFFPPGVGLGGKAEGRNFVAPMLESSNESTNDLYAFLQICISSIMMTFCVFVWE